MSADSDTIPECPCFWQRPSGEIVVYYGEAFGFFGPMAVWATETAPERLRYSPALLWTGTKLCDDPTAEDRMIVETMGEPA